MDFETKMRERLELFSSEVQGKLSELQGYELFIQDVLADWIIEEQKAGSNITIEHFTTESEYLNIQTMIYLNRNFLRLKHELSNMMDMINGHITPETRYVCDILKTHVVYKLEYLKQLIRQVQFAKWKEIEYISALEHMEFFATSAANRHNSVPLP